MARDSDRLPTEPLIAWIEDQLARIHRDDTLRLSEKENRVPAERVLADRLGIDTRVLYRYRRGLMAGARDGVKGDFPTDTFSRASIEDMLDHAEVFIWEVYDELPVDVGPSTIDRCAWNRKMTDAEVFAAHKLYTRLHLSGAELAARLHQRFGYANAKVCERCLLSAFTRLGLARRPRFARARQCTATTARGERCRCIARAEGDLCGIHDPATAANIRDAVRRNHKPQAHLSADLILAARTMHQDWGMSMAQIGRDLLDESPYVHPVALSRRLRAELRARDWYTAHRPQREPVAA